MSKLKPHEIPCDECDGEGQCDDEPCYSCDGEGKHYWPDFEAGDISQCTECLPHDDAPVMGCGEDNEEHWLCRKCWVARHQRLCGCERWGE